jgi:hypothetical protein
LYRTQTHTAQASGVHAANHAQRAGASKILKETSEALAMLATATTTDRGTMATMISTNAGFYSSLVENIAALSLVNDVISILRAAARNNGRRAAATSIGRSSSSSGSENSNRNNGGNGCNRPVTDNDNPMAIRFMQITQASHAPDTQMDKRSKQPRTTTWSVTNWAATPFDVEGQHRMKINKLTIIIIV